MPGLNARDKSIRLWMIAQRSSLAQGIEESGYMLQFLDNTPGPNPKLILDSCYKLYGLILSKEKHKVNKCCISRAKKD